MDLTFLDVQAAKLSDDLGSGLLFYIGLPTVFLFATYFTCVVCKGFKERCRGETY